MGLSGVSNPKIRTSHDVCDKDDNPGSKVLEKMCDGDKVRPVKANSAYKDPQTPNRIEENKSDTMADSATREAVSPICRCLESHDMPENDCKET